MMRLWWIPFGRVPEMDAYDLYTQLQEHAPPQIVDVRTVFEWRASRIPGAITAPILELKDRLTSIDLDRTRPVVAVCLSAHRSIPAVRLLRASGYNAFQLRQGMRAWWNATLPVERDK